MRIDNINSTEKDFNIYIYIFHSAVESIIRDLPISDSIYNSLRQYVKTPLQIHDLVCCSLI